MARLFRGKLLILLPYAQLSKLLFYHRWKTHKWSKCHLAPWSVRQDGSGAQEMCGTGLQTRGEGTHRLIVSSVVAQCGDKGRGTTKSPNSSAPPTNLYLWAVAVFLFFHHFGGFVLSFVQVFHCPPPPPLIPPALSCLQLNGTRAEAGACLEVTKAVPSVTQPCQLPCQDDCQLTHWSKFSPCTVDCVGVRVRKRALIGGERNNERVV